MPKNAGKTILGVFAAVFAANFLFLYFVVSPGEVDARDAKVVQLLCSPSAPCTTTGAQTTNFIGGGGWASYQVTCSTAGALTWPDSVTLQARDMDDHTWVTVDGHTASTADEREGVYWFSGGAEARVFITDAAGTQSCIATLAFGRHKDY